MSHTNVQARETSGELTEHTRDKGRSIAEWTTLAISTAILLTFIGLISWLSLAGSELEPVITVEPVLNAVREDDSGFYLPVTIRNEGDVTVQDAVIQGELTTGEAEPETAEISIPYLSGGEEVHGTMVFQTDPSAGDLSTGVTSFVEP